MTEASFRVLAKPVRLMQVASSVLSLHFALVWCLRTFRFLCREMRQRKCTAWRAPITVPALEPASRSRQHVLTAAAGSPAVLGGRRGGSFLSPRSLQVHLFSRTPDASGDTAVHGPNHSTCRSRAVSHCRLQFPGRTTL